MSKKFSNTFCIIPWIHIHNWPDGTVTPCCIADVRKPLGHLSEASFSEIWNNDQYKELRRKLLNNQIPESCATCFKNEELGFRTLRQDSNKEFEKYVNDVNKLPIEERIETKFKIRYADFRFSNTCNLKCRMCNPHLSSSIEAESIKHFYFSKNKNNYINELKENLDLYLSNVEICYFAGGEPLLMEEHYLIIKYFIEKNKFDIELRYSTNLTKLKQKEMNFLDIWPKFKKVILAVSLDDLEGAAEYSRYGTKWEKTLENFNKINKAEDNVVIQVQITVSIYNIFNLIKLLRFLFSYKKIEYIVLNLLSDPNHMNISILPKDIRESLYVEVEEFYKSNQIKCDLLVPSIKSLYEVLKNGNEDINLLNSFFDYSLKLDEIRGDSLFKAIPQLEQVYQYVKSK